MRRWRWALWLILVAFLAGVLRVPVAILQLTGALPADASTWYVAFQGLIGLAQLAIGLAMLADYRRSGVWEAFERSDDLAMPAWPPRGRRGALAVSGTVSLACQAALLATALGGARQISGRPPALRLGQTALGFTRSE